MVAVRQLAQLAQLVLDRRSAVPLTASRGIARQFCFVRAVCVAPIAARNGSCSIDLSSLVGSTPRGLGRIFVHQLAFVDMRLSPFATVSGTIVVASSREQLRFFCCPH